MKKFICLASILVFANMANSNTNIQCWGNNSDQQTDLPSEIVGAHLDGTAQSIATAGNLTCILNSKYKVDCWGKNNSDFSAITDLQDVANISLGEADGSGQTSMCANTKAGVQCINVGGTLPTLKAKTKIVVGLSYACSIQDGAVNCFGGNVGFNLPKLKNTKKITLNTDYACFLGEQIVHCITDNNGDLDLEKVPKLDHPTDIFMGYGFMCAKVQAGVQCWGTPSNDNLPAIPKIPRSKIEMDYVAGRTHVCGISKAGVTCWGDNTFGQLNIPALKNPKSISTNYSSNQTCAIDDTGVVCWGADNFGQSSLAAFGDISAGYGNTCVVVQGKTQCWGNGSQKIKDGLQNLKTHTLLTGISQIGLGANYGCAIDTLDVSQNSCWGENASIVQVSPSLPFDTASTFFLSVGFSHFCFSNNSSLTCFGANDFGQSTPPKDISVQSTTKSFATGGRHTCAIDTKLGVRCWGENKFGQLDVPQGLKNPRSLTAGYSHTCVVDDVGVHCWGSNDEMQITVPLLKNPKNVQAGGYHTCAVDDDGAHCWGDNSFGQTNVPATLGKSISQVTTGFLHSCAVIK